MRKLVSKSPSRNMTPEFKLKMRLNHEPGLLRRESDSHSNTPHQTLRQPDIRAGKDLMNLLPNRRKVGYVADLAVPLQIRPESSPLRIAISDPRRRLKMPALSHLRPTQRTRENRIEIKLKTMHRPFNNRPYFHMPGRGNILRTRK